MRVMDEDYKRRQKLKGKSSAFFIMGFVMCQNLIAPERYQIHGLLYWTSLAAGLAAIAYGFINYLPVRKEEKRERDEWRKKEKAELDAANAFLFGTTQNGN